MEFEFFALIISLGKRTDNSSGATIKIISYIA